MKNVQVMFDRKIGLLKKQIELLDYTFGNDGWFEHPIDAYARRRLIYSDYIKKIILCDTVIVFPFPFELENYVNNVLRHRNKKIYYMFAQQPHYKRRIVDGMDIYDNIPEDGWYLFNAYEKEEFFSEEHDKFIQVIENKFNNGEITGIEYKLLTEYLIKDLNFTRGCRMYYKSMTEYLDIPLSELKITVNNLVKKGIINKRVKFGYTLNKDLIKF